MVEVMQQVLPPEVSAVYRQGFDQLEGFVVRAGDVVHAQSADEVVEAFGYGAVPQAYLAGGGFVDVLRFVARPWHRFSTPYGPGMGPEGDVKIVEPAPFTGNGFTASTRSVVPQWRIGRTRVPAGAELWRIGPDGSESLLDVYRDVGVGWAGPTETGGLPSNLVGPQAKWGEVELLADPFEDGSVVLAHVGSEPPSGFEPVRPYLSRRVVSGAEIATVSETVIGCTWRQHPFEVIGSTGEEVLLTYVGGDFRVAEQLGLQFVQPSVYEKTVPLAEAENVQAIAREFPPLGHPAAPAS